MTTAMLGEVLHAALYERQMIRMGESPPTIESAVDFVLTLDRLKQVRRRNPLADGQRRERTAEHSWHVAAAALCLHQFAAEPVNLDRALRLAIVHDLPEVVVGDTFVYGPHISSRRGREEAAMEVMLSSVGEAIREAILPAWTDYEYEQSPEGRYVMAIDVMLPIFLNLSAGQDSSWWKHRVAADDVRKRIALVRDSIPELTEMAYRAVDEGVRQGLLR